MSAVAAASPMPRRGFFKRPLVAFFTAPSGIVGLSIVFVILLVAIFAPIFLTDYAQTQNFLIVSQGPSWAHPLGTDQLGRDIFARLLVATRLSIGLALASTFVAFLLGVTFGASATLAGPKGRLVILRIIDTLLSFPILLTAIFVTTIIGGGAKGALLGVGIAISFNISRVASNLAISIGSRDYVDAARVLGVRGPRLMTRYVLPNIAEPLIVTASVAIGASILQVSALSFLGLGVQPPTWDWGGMLTLGVKGIYLHPAGALGPAAAIAIAYIAFGLTGEAFARALNPLLWTAGTAKVDPSSTVSLDDGFDESTERIIEIDTPFHHAPEPSMAVAGVSAADADMAFGAGPEELSTGPRDAVDALEASGATETREMALEVRDLVVTFPGPNGPFDIVKGVSFAIPAGEIVGIVGESGSGKTMTALTVGQLTPFPGKVKGTIKLHGRDVTSFPPKELDKFLGTDLAIVFQDPMSSLNPALRIGRQLTEAMVAHKGMGRKDANQLAIEALTEVNIPAAERQVERYPHEFSGGMRQRAMIAMGLMKDPSLLIADEPTTALDVTIQAQIMDLLEQVNTEHETAVVLISHNLALISQTCHRVSVMYAGRIVEDLDAEQLTTNPMHPYTRALLGAVPQIDQPRDQPLEFIPGETPDIAAPPPGCPYHPRCSLAQAECSTVRPRLMRRSDGRRVACHVSNADLNA